MCYCYLQTLQSVPQTRHLQTAESFEHLRASVDCHQPVCDLYQFVGRMNIFLSDVDDGVVTVPLGPENVLLRGVRLKNTDFVYGSVAVHHLCETVVLDIRETKRYIRSLQNNEIVFTRHYPQIYPPVSLVHLISGPVNQHSNGKN